MEDFISKDNRKAKEESLWRTLSVVEESKPTEIMIEGKSYLNFSSNDYLGYSHHPQVIEAAIEALNRHGSGGRSSRLVSGTLDLHKRLEERLAQFKGTEACLLFPTGFMANLGVISALLQEGDAVIVDRLNHASLIDAARLSKCRIFVYDHASCESLGKILKRTQAYKKRLVVTDALFSMDGDIAPLPGIADLCREHKVWLMIDDAHATGIVGEQGSGLAEHFGLQGKIDIVMGTLSKALGSQGGFVCGSKEFIEFLVNRARPFIFTTALSPVCCGAALAAIDLIGKEPSRRKKLLESSGWLRKELKHNFQAESKLLAADVTPILPFWTGTAQKALETAQALRDRGIFVPAIRPPTVPKNECRLRFSLTSEHSQEDLQKLMDSLKATVKSRA